MDPQATIGTDEGVNKSSDTEDTRDQVLDVLPPEKLLGTNSISRIRGGIQCMRSVETVQKYVAYENGHAQREYIFRLLQERAAELRETGD